MAAAAWQSPRDFDSSHTYLVLARSFNVRDEQNGQDVGCLDGWLAYTAGLVLAAMALALSSTLCDICIISTARSVQQLVTSEGGTKNDERLHYNFLASASLASCCQRQCRLSVM